MKQKQGMSQVVKISFTMADGQRKRFNVVLYSLLVDPNPLREKTAWVAARIDSPAESWAWGWSRGEAMSKLRRQEIKKMAVLGDER